MFKLFETAINYLFIANHNDPIRQYCQTEFKENWKSKYYELTGKTIHQTPDYILVYIYCYAIAQYVDQKEQQYCRPHPPACV